MKAPNLQFLQPLIDFDEDLEQAVLGVCLLEPSAFGKVQHILVPECFYHHHLLPIYQAMAKLYDDGWPIDLFTVQRVLLDDKKVKLGDYPTPYLLSKLMENITGSAHLEFWCVKLRELAIRRTAIMVTSSGIDRTSDVLDIAGDIEKKLKQLTDLKSVDDWEDASEVAMKLVARMEATARGEGASITTSLNELDNINGGLRAGQLVLIGARPGVGKSAFMGRMAIHAAKKTTVGVISLEMDSEDVFARMVAFETATPFWRIDKAEFESAEQYQSALQHIADTAALPIKFSDRAQVNMRDIRAKAEKLKRKHGVGIMFIDYLQLIEAETTKGGMREQEVAKISRGCKLLAKTMEIPIVLMVQLNRQADGEEPQLKHLRESGSLEQDADIVFMLYRDVDTEDPALQDKATLFVRKWRNGSPCRIDLHFNGEHMRFSERSEIDVFKPAQPQQFDNPSAGIKPNLSVFNSKQDDEPLPF
jgi:replicative DNA helicase